MWRELLELWQSVRDPEYAHLLLESLPLYGLALGLVMLLTAFETICNITIMRTIFS